MTTEPSIHDETLDALRHLDTCTVPTAIETFDVWLESALLCRVAKPWDFAPRATSR